MTDLLSEPESIAERRKELNDMIKVMKNAQKIIRRDPDLMTVMQININDSDITNHQQEVKTEKKEYKPKEAPKIEIKGEPNFKASEPKKESPKPANDTKSKTTIGKKGGYGNLFG